MRVPWRKPPGKLAIDWNKAPRGLSICFDCNDPSFPNLVTGQAGTLSGAMTLGAMDVGVAYDPNGDTSNKWSYVKGSSPAVCSVEIFANSGQVFSGGLCGMAEAVPTAANRDRQLFISGGGLFSFVIFDGATKTVNSTTNTVGNAHKNFHVVCVSDGTNIHMYVNGVLEASTAAGTAFTFTNPIFAFGYAQQSGSSNRFMKIALCNFATAAWSAEEVRQRYFDPFGFLISAQDAMPAMFVAAAPGGSIIPNVIHHLRQQRAA